MEFAAMKRRDLLELCRQHGLGTRGSKADLAASLAGAISGAAAASAGSVVEVVVGKGCLKRQGAGASGGTSGAAKKVRFTLDEGSEERARRQRSQVILQPVVTKTRGRRKAREVHPAVAVSGRGRRRKRDDVGGDSADEDVTGEVGADAPVMRSTMKAVCLCAQSGAESRKNPAEAEKEGEVVEAAIDRKWKQKTHENVEVIAANARGGISHRITRSPSSSSAALLLFPSVEKKKGRRKARDGIDKLGAEEQAAVVQDLTTAASLVIIKSRSSRKGEDCIPSAQKPPKVVVSHRTTRSSSVVATVILPTDIGNKWRKTRGRPKAEEALPATVVSGRGRRRKCDVGGDSVDHGTFGEVGADALVTLYRTEAMNLCAESGVESQNNPAEVEEKGQVVGAAIDSRKQKRKWNAQENAEGITANAQAGVSQGSTRKSSLSAAAVLLSAVAGNKRGRRKVGDDKDELGVEEQAAQVQDLATTVSPVDVENERSRRKGEDCVPAVQKSGRTTRPHSVAAVAILPIVTGNKVREAEDVHPDGELPADLEVPRNDAPVTRSLRNRIVEIYSSVVEETHVGKKFEDKRKPGRPSARRHQQLASSIKEEEQIAAPPLKRSMRNHPEADQLLSNANCRLPVAKDLKIVHPLTLNTSNTSVEDFVAKTEKELGFSNRSSEDKRKNAGGVSFSDDSGNKSSAAKMELGVLDERTTGMHEIVSGEEFQSAKGGDVGEQPAVPVR